MTAPTRMYSALSSIISLQMLQNAIQRQTGQTIRLVFKAFTSTCSQLDTQWATSFYDIHTAVWEVALTRTLLQRLTHRWCWHCEVHMQCLHCPRIIQHKLVEVKVSEHGGQDILQSER